MSEAHLLEELVRGKAPATMLRAEGFTESEIVGARATVSLDPLEKETAAPLLAGQQ